jgi:polysaccharide export outer membrane protein
MCFKYSLVLVITGALLTAAPQDSQSSPAPTVTEDAPPSGTFNLTFEPVNCGDLVQLSVANYSDISRSYRISQDGTISIPAFLEPLRIAGLTPHAVEMAVTKALLDAKLLVKPIVSVVVLEYRSRPVQISGAVKHPITIQALGDMRLLDALAKSDGLASDAGFEITVLRTGADTGVQAELRIPVRELLDGSNPELNIPLHGGEQIRVPRAGRLYIVGNVKAPGAFPITDADGLSVLKAVGLSQGLLPFSQEYALLYRLVPETGKRTELTVPVRDILKHRAADVLLQASDILYIPDHAGKRLAVTVLEKLAGVGTTAATVATWRSIE